MAQPFADHLEAVQAPHGGQDVRRLGALTASRLNNLVVVAPREQGVEQQRLRRPGQQAAATFAEDRRIKAGIRELQARCILPVDATAHGISRLAIGEPFGELEEGDERQPPRG